MLDLPERAQPSQRLDVNIQVRGGVLVVSGRKGGYTVRVDWGDGSSPLVEQNVGQKRTSLEGAIVPAAHAYANPGRYTIRIEVCDATGWSEANTREITIAEAAAVAPVSATRTNTPTSSPAAARPPAKVATGTATRTSSPTAGRPPARVATSTATRAFTPTMTRPPTVTTASTPTATRGLLVWIRQDQPIINVTNDPLEQRATEQRFEGTFTAYLVNETSIASEHRYVDRGFESYNVTFTCNFDRPPLVLLPGQSYKLKAVFEHGGTVADASNPGERFWYSAQRGYEGILDPHDPPFAVLSYFPWTDGFSGTSSKEWMLTGPPATHLGDTFDMYASWWNCAPCNVTWTYRLEYH